MAAGPTGMNEGVGSEGGFLVQTDFQTSLLDDLYAGGDLLKLINPIPISANANGIAMNGVDETSRANGSRAGGIQAFWTAEAGLKGASQPKFRNIKMDLDKLTGLCYATDELLQDTSALEAWIKEAFNTEFTFKLEDAIINGTGSGMPLGILNSGASSPFRRKPARPTAPSPPPTSPDVGAHAGPQQEERGLAHQRRRPAGSGHLVLPIKNVAGTENVGGCCRRSSTTSRPARPAAERTARSWAARSSRPSTTHARRHRRHHPVRSDAVPRDRQGADPVRVVDPCSVHLRRDRLPLRLPFQRYSRSGARSQTPYKGSNTRSPFVVLAAR
jgi:hypothetical protein